MLEGMTVAYQGTPMLQDVAAQFLPPGRDAAIREFGNGNINKTYLVTPVDGDAPFLLQRLNTHVFPRPDLVMANIQAVTRHLARRDLPSDAASDRRWDVPQVRPTHAGADHWRAPDGGYWRAWTFIPRSRAIDAVRDPAIAREVGFALGTFHGMLSDLPAAELADTLPGFHVAPGYLARYDAVAAIAGAPTSEEERWCAGFIAAHRAWVPVLEDALAAGELRARPIHGDPKVNNILFDDARDLAIAMVDWDTIKPGLVQYDVGDCLRSSCNPDGEEAADWRAVRFDLGLAGAVLEGYLAVARGFFEPADFDYVPASARLLAFELGLRFFTDHLEGDVYFKVPEHGQNLARALVQFRLAQSVDAQLGELTALVDALR